METYALGFARELAKALAQRVGVSLSAEDLNMWARLIQDQWRTSRAGPGSLPQLAKTAVAMKKGLTQIPEIALADLKTLFTRAQLQAAMGVGKTNARAASIFTKAKADLTASGHYTSTYSSAAAAKSAVQKRLVEILERDQGFRSMWDTAAGRDLLSGYSQDSAGFSKLVRDWIHDWAMTSADAYPNSLCVQRAAMEVFGLDPAGWARLQASFVTEGGEARWAALQLGYKAFVRAQHQATQEMLIRLGFDVDKDFLWLYRGMGRRGAQWEAPDVVGSWGPVELQPLSSFSHSYATAKKFSGGEMVELARVPMKDILSFALTGNGCLNEQEWVIIGRAFETVTLRPSVSTEWMIMKYLLAILSRG